MSPILTLLYNLQSSNREGRLLDVEFGHTTVALSDLARGVPVESRTDLSAAVYDVADTIRRPMSQEFRAAVEAMGTACEDAGAPLTLHGWIGG
jgi:hypothetical protein